MSTNVCDRLTCNYAFHIAKCGARICTSKCITFKTPLVPDERYILNKQASNVWANWSIAHACPYGQEGPRRPGHTEGTQRRQECHDCTCCSMQQVMGNLFRPCDDPKPLQTVEEPLRVCSRNAEECTVTALDSRAARFYQTSEAP